MRSAPSTGPDWAHRDVPGGPRLPPWSRSVASAVAAAVALGPVGRVAGRVGDDVQPVVRTALPVRKARIPPGDRAADVRIRPGTRDEQARARTAMRDRRVAVETRDCVIATRVAGESRIRGAVGVAVQAEGPCRHEGRPALRGQRTVPRGVRSLEDEPVRRTVWPLRIGDRVRLVAVGAGHEARARPGCRDVVRGAEVASGRREDRMEAARRLVVRPGPRVVAHVGRVELPCLVGLRESA